MPASSALVKRIQRSMNPEEDLKKAYADGEYQPITDKPTERQDPGYTRPKNRIYGSNLATRVRAYANHGMGGPMSLPKSPDQLASRKNPDGTHKPDPAMVTKANGGQVLKSDYDAEQEAAKKAKRRAARLARPASMPKPASTDTIASSEGGSVLDDMRDPKSAPAPKQRLVKPEAMINGQKSSEFFKDTAKRQKQSNQFAQYVPEPKKEEEDEEEKKSKKQNA